MNKEFKLCLLLLSVICRVLKLRLLAFSQGPGGFREVREAHRNHFHLSWYLLVPRITSYGQKPSWESVLPSAVSKDKSKSICFTTIQRCLNSSHSMFSIMLVCFNLCNFSSCFLRFVIVHAYSSNPIVFNCLFCL